MVKHQQQVIVMCYKNHCSLLLGASRLQILVFKLDLGEAPTPTPPSPTPPFSATSCKDGYFCIIACINTIIFNWFWNCVCFWRVFLYDTQQEKDSCPCCVMSKLGLNLCGLFCCCLLSFEWPKNVCLCSDQCFVWQEALCGINLILAFLWGCVNENAQLAWT